MWNACRRWSFLLLKNVAKDFNVVIVSTDRSKIFNKKFGRALNYKKLSCNLQNPSTRFPLGTIPP